MGTSRVSDTLCAGANMMNPCSCKCGSGDLQTVGDKVCEARGAAKPTFRESRLRRCAARHQRLSALLYGKNRSPLQLRCPRQRVIFFGWTCLALHRSRLQHLLSTTRRLSVFCRPLHEGPKSIRYRWISHNNDIAPSKKM